MTTHIGTMKRHGSWAAIVIGVALVTPRLVLAQDVTSQTLIYATYDGEKTAGEVFKTMKSNQKATGERIESYAIVSRDLKGKTRVHDQRRKNTAVGAVLGAVIGVLGGPVGAVAGATAGGGLGYLTGDSVGISRQTVDDMKAALTPGSSALVVVLDDRWVQDVEKGLRQANARQVIREQIARGASKTPTRVPAAATPSHP
jgi:uncharacterized membrane protein